VVAFASGVAELRRRTMDHRAALEKVRSFRGHILPITSPFTTDLALDLPGLAQNIRKFADIPGCGGIYFGSVYQEFWTLTVEERKSALETIMKETNNRLPVIAGVSSTSVNTTVELACHAESAGADMLMVWPPIFGPRDIDGVVAFYRAVCGETSLPICVYSSVLPELGFYLAPEALQRLTEFDNIVAVKEASFNLTTFLSLIDTLGDRFAISSPFEEYWIAGKQMCPEKSPDFLMGSSRAMYMQTADKPIFAEIAQLVYDGRPDRAYAMLSELRPLIHDLQMASFRKGHHPIAMVKWAMELLGTKQGPVRPPTPSLTREERESVTRALREAGLTKDTGLHGYGLSAA
jgi:4-hydroxy-tetrahydrodipicolinate synthase